MIYYFPEKTGAAIKLESLIQPIEKPSISEEMSVRMVKCASLLENNEFIGWQMTAPAKGMIDMIVFGSSALCTSDLEWIVEKTAKNKMLSVEQKYSSSKASASKSPLPTSSISENLNSEVSMPKCLKFKDFNTKYASRYREIYEIYLPISEKLEDKSAIGFGVNSGGLYKKVLRWPVYFSSQFEEFVRALQVTGAVFRAVIGPATEEERQDCYKNTLRTFDVNDIDVKEYIGTPVKARFLLMLPNPPSVRLRTILEGMIPSFK